MDTSKQCPISNPLVCSPQGCTIKVVPESLERGLPHLPFARERTIFHLDLQLRLEPVRLGFRDRLTAEAQEALKLQRPLPDGKLRIVATGVRKDEATGIGE